MVIVNSSPYWSDHISLVNQKVSKSIGILTCVKVVCQHIVFFVFCFSTSIPYYEYANIVWAVRDTVVLQKLFITQKKAVCKITNSPWNAHTYPLFRKTHILTIQELQYISSWWGVLCLKWIKVLCLHTFPVFFYKC